MNALRSGASLLVAMLLVLGAGNALAGATTSQIKQALTKVGCFDGPIDDRYTLALENAIGCFQHHLGSPTDGRLTDKQVRALITASIVGERVDPANPWAVTGASGKPAPQAAKVPSAAGSPDTTLPPEPLSGPWRYLDLEAFRTAEFVDADQIPGVSAVPPHPEWGTLMVIKNVKYRDGRGTIHEEPRPAYLRTYGRDCQVMVLETLVVSPAIWPSQNWTGAASPVAAINRALTRRGHDVSTCEARDGSQYLHRMVNELTGEEAYFRFRHRLGPDLVQRWLAAAQNPDAPHRVAELDNLGPLKLSGLKNADSWNYYYNAETFNLPGRRHSPGDTLVASYAYLGLTLAYSKAAFDSGDACRYPGDTSWRLTSSTERDGVRETMRIDRVYIPRHHAARFRAVSGLSRVDLRTFLADAKVMVLRDGCAGPQVALLRENIWRFLEGRNPMSLAEAAQLTPARVGATATPRRSPVANADWRAFVKSCFREYPQARQSLSDYQVVACLCKEHHAWEAGDATYYRNKSADWFATATPRYLIARGNRECGRPLAQQPARVRAHFAATPP